MWWKLSLPSYRHRPKSSLERGGTRSRPATANPIEETDENAPEQEPPKVEEVKPPEEPAPVEVCVCSLFVCLSALYELCIFSNFILILLISVWWCD